MGAKSKGRRREDAASDTHNPRVQGFSQGSSQGGRTDQREVLKLLTWEARENKFFWREPLRRKKEELESIANQLEAVARQAKSRP